jgi:hypothetical protein
MWRGRLTKEMTRGLRRRSALIVLILSSALAVAAIAVAATNAPSVPAPTITSKPANPTNQTSASFTYTDSQAGVTFQCALDGAAFSSCASSGITYSGLAAGEHTFRVQAVGEKKTSSAASYTWTIDTSPPAIALSFPSSSGNYQEEAWNAGCSAGPGLCGSATDSSGVSSVVVSIQQGSGSWWGGSSFNKASEFFNNAALASPGAKSTEWSYPLPLPPDGSYTVHVRAADVLGNPTSAQSQLVRAFKVKAAPEPPAITSGPGERTEATTATFTFTDSDEKAKFLCRIDTGSFVSCKSPTSYTGLTPGAHTFYVEAKDGKATSAPASYAWTVGKKAIEEQPFTISGNLAGALAPGVSQSLPLTISNTNGVAILVTSLGVTPNAGSSKAGCDGPTNLQVTQSNVSATNALTVPANSQVTLPSSSVSAPQVLMLNLSSNQDACKGASFTFRYSGSAHS